MSLGLVWYSEHLYVSGISCTYFQHIIFDIQGHLDVCYPLWLLIPLHTGIWCLCSAWSALFIFWTSPRQQSERVFFVWFHMSKCILVVLPLTIQVSNIYFSLFLGFNSYWNTCSQLSSYETMSISGHLFQIWSCSLNVDD